MILRRFELTPYRIKLALDVLTALVIVSIAFALAGLTWRLLGHAGTGAVTVPAGSRPAPVADISPAVALAPFGKAVVDGDSAVATGLQIQLRGIVHARPDTLSVAFISEQGAPAKPYKVGDAVAGAQIDAIQPRRVLLKNGGRSEFLAFPDPAATAASPTTPAAAAPPPVPGAMPAPAVLPTPPATAGVEQVMQRLDARPAGNGYQVGANAPPGLRQGDMLTQVNGTALTSPDAARQAIAAAQASGNAQIQVVRDGKPLTITVPIR